MCHENLSFSQQCQKLRRRHHRGAINLLIWVQKTTSLFPVAIFFYCTRVFMLPFCYAMATPMPRRPFQSVVFAFVLPFYCFPWIFLDIKVPSLCNTTPRAKEFVCLCAARRKNGNFKKARRLHCCFPCSVLLETKASGNFLNYSSASGLPFLVLVESIQPATATALLSVSLCKMKWKQSLLYFCVLLCLSWWLSSRRGYGLEKNHKKEPNKRHNFIWLFWNVCSRL